MTKLQAKRKALDLTQERVAMLAGITSRTLTDHERGVGRKASYNTQAALARVLGCQIGHIFENGRAK